MKVSVVALMLLLLLPTTTVQAIGLANTVEVDFVRVDSDGRGYVNFKTALISEPASCTNGYPNALAFDTNTAGGRAILSVALAAKSSGKKIYAKGTGACTVYGVMEDWSWGAIKD